MLLPPDRRSRVDFVFLWLILAMLGSATPSFAVGEPVNGFPNWYERVVHVITNRARCDPAAALVGCSPCADVDLGCYTPQAPVQWDLNLNRAARFHATNLTDAGCGLQHNSPCYLDPSIGTDYPDVCDGSVSCACATSVSCGVTGTSVFDRIAMFGVATGYRAENIGPLINDPFVIFDLWLLESMTTSTCGFHCTDYDDCNGHRYSILNPNHTRMGVGGLGDYVVQDFWSGGDLDQKIPSAAHYPEDGGPTTEFRVNWYDSAAPAGAWVNIDGECFAMALERGSGDNGTYLYTTATTGCSRYFFQFRDSAGEVVVYPETGSYGIGCTTDWEATGPEPCDVSAVDGNTPYRWSLEQNYPNPFNPLTTISFVLPDKQRVSVRVYDLGGRLIDTLIDDEPAVAGRNEVVWRGRDADGEVVPAGVYFYRLDAGASSETGKMVMVK